MWNTDIFVGGRESNAAIGAGEGRSGTTEERTGGRTTENTGGGGKEKVCVAFCVEMLNERGRGGGEVARQRRELEEERQKILEMEEKKRFV